MSKNKILENDTTNKCAQMKVHIEKIVCADFEELWTSTFIQILHYIRTGLGSLCSIERFMT